VINFFTLNVYSIIGFIVLCCIAIGYFVLSRVLLFIAQPLYAQNFILIYLATAIAGLIYLSIDTATGSGIFELCMLIWLLIYLTMLKSNYLSLLISKVSSSRLVAWLFFFLCLHCHNYYGAE